MAFGENLKELREKAGISQAELAEAIGISQSAIWQLEAGETNPRLITVKALANYFNTTVKELKRERVK